MDVEVALALPDAQYLVRLQVAAGTTVREAVQQSGLAQRLPALNIDTMPIGIFGKIVPDHTVLQQHDRVELYRPLLIDPKENRRRRHERDHRPKS